MAPVGPEALVRLERLACLASLAQQAELADQGDPVGLNIRFQNHQTIIKFMKLSCRNVFKGLYPVVLAVQSELASQSERLAPGASARR